MNGTTNWIQTYRRQMFQRVLIKKYGGSAQNADTNGKQRFTRVPPEKAALNVQKPKGEKMDNIHIFGCILMQLCNRLQPVSKIAL